MKTPYFTAEDFQDPIQEGIYLDMGFEAAKICADMANAKIQPILDELEKLRERDWQLLGDTEQFD